VKIRLPNGAAARAAARIHVVSIGLLLAPSGAALAASDAERSKQTMKSEFDLPGQAVKAEPAGLNAMLMGLRNPLVTGKRVPLVLTFQQAGAITAQVDLQSIASAAPKWHAALAGH
jgi:hypothetical protein